MHLTPEQFVDLADGTQPEAALPHLAECGACRDQLEVMRATLSMAAVDAQVPEPSPLFWDRLSNDVRTRIDREPDPRAWWSAWLRPQMLVPLSAVTAVAVLIAVAFTPATIVPPAPGTTSAPASSTTSGATVPDSPGDAGDATDPMLTLVTDLSASIDLDAAADAGFAAPDAAEHAVTHMSADELRALRRLLQAELTRRGA